MSGIELLHKANSFPSPRNLECCRIILLYAVKNSQNKNLPALGR